MSQDLGPTTTTAAVEETPATSSFATGFATVCGVCCAVVTTQLMDDSGVAARILFGFLAGSAGGILGAIAAGMLQTAARR